MKCFCLSAIMYCVLSAVYLLALPGDAASEAGADEQDQNQQLLETWRADPEHFARLRRDLRAFLALPAERQERMRKLDRDLHEEDSATSAYLWRVLRRYADWLERLPAAERQQLEAITNPQERLERIRDMREREWVEQLPQATRAKVENAPAEERAALISQLRKEDRKRRQEWQVAMKNWDELLQNRPQPSRLSEFPPDVQDFVDKILMPMLSKEEKDRLLLAEGHWPQFPRILVELADRHPIQLPGPTTGPSRFQELPPAIQQRLSRFKNWPPAAVKRMEGKWPDYALAVWQFARKRDLQLPPLGPARPPEFPPAVQQFLEQQLLPVLTSKERQDLNKAEGDWPDYAREMRSLARAHDLTVPGTALPGPRKLWDKFRPSSLASPSGLPVIPEHVLIDFALKELTAQERTALRLSFADPASVERLKKEWIRRHPREWQRLQTADRLKKQRKARNLE